MLYSKVNLSFTGYNTGLDLISLNFSNPRPFLQEGYCLFCRYRPLEMFSKSADNIMQTGDEIM